MLTARSLGIPGATAHDYEFATAQHQLGLRAATRVVFPDAVPPERLARYGAKPPKLRRYPGIEEEYYLADFEPDQSRRSTGSTRTRCSPSCGRRRTSRSTTGTTTRCFAGVLERLGRDESVHAIVLPRTGEQRDAIRSLALPSLHVPEHAVDAQSLVALADLVVSAGGTMNREAAALGTPVYTIFAGRLGAVDEALIRDGRLRAADRRRGHSRSASAIREQPRVRRDPRLLLDLLLSA